MSLWCSPDVSIKEAHLFHLKSIQQSAVEKEAVSCIDFPLSSSLIYPFTPAVNIIPAGHILSSTTNYLSFYYIFQQFLTPEGPQWDCHPWQNVDLAHEYSSPGKSIFFFISGVLYLYFNVFSFFFFGLFFTHCLKRIPPLRRFVFVWWVTTVAG